MNITTYISSYFHFYPPPKKASAAQPEPNLPPKNCVEEREPPSPHFIIYDKEGVKVIVDQSKGITTIAGLNHLYFADQQLTNEWVQSAKVEIEGFRQFNPSRRWVQDVLLLKMPNIETIKDNIQAIANAEPNEMGELLNQRKELAYFLYYSDLSDGEKISILKTTFTDLNATQKKSFLNNYLDPTYITEYFPQNLAHCSGSEKNKSLNCRLQTRGESPWINLGQRFALDALCEHLDFTDPKVSSRCLQLAVKMNSPKILDLITPFLSPQDKNCLPLLLIHAAEYGYKPIVEKILNLGCDPNHSQQKNQLGKINQIKNPLAAIILNIATIDDSKKRNDLIACFDLLLKRRGDPNSPVISPETGITSPLLDYCLLYSAKNERDVMKLAFLLLKNGAKISDTAQKKILEKLTQAPALQTYLIQAGKVSSTAIDLILNPPSSPDSEPYLLSQMLEATQFLIDTSLQRGNWKLIDHQKINTLKELKRLAKGWLKTHLPKNPALFKKHYEQFSAVYDQLVEEVPLLKEMRATSQELRDFANNPEKNSPPSSRLTAIFSLWSPDGAVDYSKAAATNKIKNMSNEKRRTIWPQMFQHVMEAANDIKKSRDLLTKEITFIHGTKLTPPLLESAKIMSAKEREENRKVALAGEMNGHASFIYGIDPSSSYNNPNTYFDAATRALVSETYSLQMHGFDANEKFFNLQASKNRTTPQAIQYLLDSNKGADDREFTLAATDIGRIQAVDPNSENHLRQLQNWLRNQQDVRLNPIKKALLHPVEKIKNPQMKALLEEPLSIVFASTTATGMRLTESSEMLIEGSLEFRKDIQMAFVKKEDLEKTKEYLAPFQIEVYPFEILHFLEMRKMIDGERDAEFIKRQPNQQNQIAYLLEHYVLPHYSLPFPKNPSYLDHNRAKQMIEQPYFGHQIRTAESYQKAVDQRQIPPRDIHGRMHASRVAILAQLLHRFFPGNTSDPVHLAYAAAYHDAARQDEGIDRWDLESSQLLANFLTTSTIPKRGAAYSKELEARFTKSFSEDLYPYVAALADKDPKNNDFTTREQMIVHDADCLEILRCLPSTKDFRIDELQIFTKGILTKAQTETLVKEWHSFIRLTQSANLNRHLEFYSKNYYKDVLAILRDYGSRTCPSIRDDLNPLFGEIRDWQLSDETHHILKEALLATVN